MRTLSYALAASLLALGLAGQANTASVDFTDAVAVLSASLNGVGLKSTGTAVANSSQSGDHVRSLRISTGVLAMNGSAVPAPQP